MLDDDTKLELDLTLDELELIPVLEELLFDRLFDDAELGIITTAEDEALLKLELPKELVVTLALEVFDALVIATFDALELATVLFATDELLATEGISLDAFAGVLVLLAASVPAPPPHALNTKAAVNTSEIDFMFIVKSISPLFVRLNLREAIPFFLYEEVDCLCQNATEKH